MSRAKFAAAAVAAVLMLSSDQASAQQLCDVASDCDDGLFCNGEEICFGGHICSHDHPFGDPSSHIVPCSREQVCDEDADRCLTPCEEHQDCDDGLFCTGTELCAPDDSRADLVGCVRTPTCLQGQRCLEEEMECASFCPVVADQDGDGFDSVECGGADCDDGDPGRNPGNVEVCDADDVDEDCNPLTFGEMDADGDGYVDDRCCNFDDDMISHCGDDCSDSRRDMNPGHLETCDLLDNDCNGFVDDRVSVLLYPDSDMDGFGDASAEPERLCAGTAGFSPYANDCNDSNPAVVPGAMVCANEGNEDVLICSSGGVYLKDFCPVLTDSVCVNLPNGLGDCEPRKCIEEAPPPVPTD